MQYCRSCAYSTFNAYTDGLCGQCHKRFLNYLVHKRYVEIGPIQSHTFQIMKDGIMAEYYTNIGDAWQNFDFTKPEVQVLFDEWLGYRDQVYAPTTHAEDMA